MYQTELLLEGGGMKGIYAAGVLDFFLDKELAFSSCYDVSTCVCAMYSCLSKQKKRTYHVNIDYLKQKSYCISENLLK